MAVFIILLYTEIRWFSSADGPVQQSVNLMGNCVIKENGWTFFNPRVECEIKNPATRIHRKLTFFSRIPVLTNSHIPI